MLIKVCNFILMFIDSTLEFPIIPKDEKRTRYTFNQIPNSKDILSKNVHNLRGIMNEFKKGGNKKKTTVINRILQSRKILLEHGFNASLIETEDIHVVRRSMDDVINRKIRECSKQIKEKGGF